MQILFMVNLSGVISKIRLFALIESFHLGVTLCTWYVGIFMSHLSNHFQMHNSNCSLVITVQHVLHYHCIIILNSKREGLLITNCKLEVVNFFIIVACFLLRNSPASEFYMPTFRNTLSVSSSQAGRYEVVLYADVSEHSVPSS